VAALTKPFFLVYPVILVIIDWIRYKNIKNSLKLFFTSFIFLSLIIAPWAYRNYINFKLFIPVSYNGGYVLFINNNENNVSGAWMPLSSIDISENANTQFLKAGFNYRASNSNDENQVLLNPKLESIFKTEAIKWILNHPQKFFYLGIIRIHNTFFNGAGDVYEWAIDNKSVSKISTFLNTNFLHKLLNKYIYILSFCGFIYVALNFKNIIISLFKNQYKINYKISIPFFNILFFILISFVFEGQPRYNFPVLFLFSICMINYMEKILKLIKRLSSTYATKPMLK
jgi:hypothetical protein